MPPPVSLLPNAYFAGQPPERTQFQADMMSKSDEHTATATSQAERQKRTQRLNSAFEQARLCWTRRDLVQATGFSYRTVVNLETRGLLWRCCVGVNVACYTDASVRALFGNNGAQ